MEKRNLIDKLNIKDYNNSLEKILVKKDFSEDAKNLLLSVFYKIGNSYDDYKKVKVDVNLKNDILQQIIDIIDKECEKIEIVKQKTKICKENEPNKIITLLDEKITLYKIIELGKQKFTIQEKYVLIKKYLENALKIGYIINISEVIRDFDGWAWNISAKNIDNIVYNFLYQTMVILVGNSFLEQWKNSENDNIEQFKKRLENRTTIEDVEKILELIYQISIIEYILDNEEERKKLLEYEETLKIQCKEINNKKLYLQKIANQKKKIGKEIKDIDNIINDDFKLKTEFINKNKFLKLEERIFSLSDYAELLQTNRDKLLKELEVYANQMKPANYIAKKNNLNKQFKLLENVKLNEEPLKRQEELIAELINLAYKILNIKLKNSENKKEIIELFYKIRYYKFIPINIEQKIGDIEAGKKELEKLEKRIITKSCNMKIINIFSKNVEENFNILKEIFNTKIIDLENIYIEVIQKEKNCIIKIYDEKNLEAEIECKEIKEPNIKYNKRIKLFS